jgi:hypothetical protein
MGYSWLMKGGKGRNLAGIARRGLKTAGSFGDNVAGWGRNRITANKVGSFWHNRGGDAAKVGWWAESNSRSARGWLANRKNIASVNKYGSMALGALGAGAAAHIGSSVLSSNRGF